MQKFQIFLLLSATMSLELFGMSHENSHKRPRLTDLLQASSNDDSDCSSEEDNDALPEGQTVEFDKTDSERLAVSIQDGLDEVNIFAECYGDEILQSKDPVSGKSMLQIAHHAENREAFESIKAFGYDGMQPPVELPAHLTLKEIIVNNKKARSN